MANTQLGDILTRFLQLFDDIFTIGDYINIKDIPFNVDYYASVVFGGGNVSKHITNCHKYTYDIDLVIYINNTNANDVNNRIQYVMDNVLTICTYDDSLEFKQFCGDFQLINAGTPVEFRTSQGLLLEKNQEMIVFSFSFYKN
ncbi:MAG: hypothetical protein QXG00_06700 [Candidatus Woesearchaeota archaeon]